MAAPTPTPPTATVADPPKRNLADLAPEAPERGAFRREYAAKIAAYCPVKSRYLDLKQLASDCELILLAHEKGLFNDVDELLLVAQMHEVLGKSAKGIDWCTTAFGTLEHTVLPLKKGFIENTHDVLTDEEAGHTLYRMDIRSIEGVGDLCRAYCDVIGVELLE